MSLISTLKNKLYGGNGALAETAPATAYNLWAESYDHQPNNLMLALDEQIFSELLGLISVEGSVVVDIGCGTGRHWHKVMQRSPRAVYGYDVSPGMLAKLQQKFPGATTYEMQNNMLPQLPGACADVVISTLTLAHIGDIEEAFGEWHRILKSGGDVIITDYHPVALARGGQRTFAHNGKTIAIKNYVHTVDVVTNASKMAGFEFVDIRERIIDDTVRHYYEESNALSVFEKFRNVPIIYGMRLRKKNAANLNNV